MSLTIRSSVSRVVRASCVAVAVPGLLAAAMPSFAQEGLEEIIVVAQKRAENMQQVPIAITALTGDAAGRIGVVNAQTLAMVVPGLRLDRQTNGTIPFLRGVGNPSSQIAAEPAVAIYVDDVYMSSTQANLTNYNSIDRIEVLKGPQGTLFGRNATGGVIQVFTKNPTPEKQLDLTLGYANYDTVNAHGYATGALSDTVSANIALYKEEQNRGWGDNLTTGHDAYLTDNEGGRAKILWEPEEATSVLLSVDFDNYDNDQGMYFRPADGTESSVKGGLTGEAQIAARLGISCFGCSIPPSGDYDTFEHLDPTGRADQWGTSMKIRHDFDAFSLVSISAYREGEAEQEFAQDGARIPRLTPHLIYDTETFTQELQFLSPDDSPIQWTAGLFYMDDKAHLSTFEFTGLITTFVVPPPLPGNGPWLPPGNAGRGASSTNNLKSYSGFLQLVVPVGDKLNITGGIRRTTDERDMSAYRINRTIAGLDTPKRFAANSGVEEKWSSWSGKFSIDYQFTDSIMAYAAYNRGFKAGAFNAIPAIDGGSPLLTATGQPNQPSAFNGAALFAVDPPVEPEKLDSYTAGFKSQFWNDRVRLNGEAFFYKYEGLQLQKVLLIPPALTVTQLTNAGKAEMKGIEFDLTVLPAEGWTVTAGVQFMEGEYKEFANGSFFVYNPVNGGNCATTVRPATAVGPFPITNCGVAVPGSPLPPNYDPATGNWDLKGNDTINTPKFSSALTVSYLMPTEVGDFDFTLSWSHTAKYFAEADNGMGQVFPSRPSNAQQDVLDLFNGSISWYSSNEKWNVRLWGKNLSDKRYWSFANETTTVTKQVPAPPRTYGLTFTAHL
jgi:iron complex outermembrane recepter protein